MDPAEPFDRAARRLQRDRAAAGFAAHAFLKDAMVEEIVARAADTGQRFDRVLDLGAHDGRLGRRLGALAFTDAGERFARAAGGVVADEDRLPFADASFDLIVSAGSLHGVNDLPGALVVPVAVTGGEAIFPIGDDQIFPGPVHVRFGAAVDPELHGEARLLAARDALIALLPDARRPETGEDALV